MTKNTFSTRLKELLEQKRLTLAEVAKAINISIPSIHRWTRGGEIEYENLRALANFLEVNWVWLRYGNEAIEGLNEAVFANDGYIDERRKRISSVMESEARMSLAQDMANIVTWEWNILTDDLMASPSSEKILGLQIENIRSELLPFGGFGFESLITLFNSGDHFYEWEFHLSSNELHSERWFVSRGRLIFDLQERPLKVVGVSMDISQSIETRKALEQNEYLLRKVIETIPVGLWFADQNGRITNANPEAERIWGGVKLVELEQYGEYKGWWEKTGKEIGSDGWTLSRAIQKGEVSLGEIVNIEAFDGEKRTIMMSAIPLLGINNEIIGAIEVNQDITPLKRAEEAFGVIVEQWKAIFEQSLVGIAFHKEGSGLLHVNARLSELTNFSLDELAVEKLENLFDEETFLEYQVNMISVEKITTINRRGTLLCKSGEVVNVHLCIVSNKYVGSFLKTLIFVF